MNPRSIRILADDLTGALDTAAAFAGNVPVFIDRPPALERPENDAAVAVLATATRDVAVDTLAAHLQPALDWLRTGAVAFKKVDSLLRGNTFAETAWIAQYGQYDLTVFAPAFPAQGRITADDRQWLVKPDGARQAVASPLRETFHGFGRQACPTLDNGDGRAGDTCRACDTWIPEVLNDADLDRIAATADQPTAGRRLWCGSAGLAHALARRWNLAPAAGSVRPLPRCDGPTVLVSASFQPVLREQWDRLCAGREMLAVARHANGDAIAAALRQARCGASEICFDLSPREKIAPERATGQLAGHTTQLVEHLPRPGQLLVIGGDTLLALCRATGAQALLAHPSARPGWGCARLIGGAWDGVPCYSRSGAFGAPDDLIEMIRLLCNG